MKLESRITNEHISAVGFYDFLKKVQVYHKFYYQKHIIFNVY